MIGSMEREGLFPQTVLRMKGSSAMASPTGSELNWEKERSTRANSFEVIEMALGS